MDRHTVISSTTNHHQEYRVSYVTHIDDVRSWVSALAQRERRRGAKTQVVRERLARAIGCAKGTIENIMNGRLKRVDAWLRESIRRALIAEIEREIKALTHELEILRAAGGDARRLEVAEIEACLERARSLLAGEG